MGVFFFPSPPLSQVFDDLQKMLNVTESQPQVCLSQSREAEMLRIEGTLFKDSPILRMVVGLFVAVATVTMGIYIL